MSTKLLYLEPGEYWDGWPGKGQCCAAGKVTVGPACVTDFVVYPPKGSVAYGKGGESILPKLL